MAEVLPSSFRLQGVESADSVFSKLLINNLFKDATFKPGVTFTDKYTERAGQIYIRRLGKPVVQVTDATAANGMKFTHTQTADSLVLISRKDRVSVSEEIYELVDALRSSGRSVDKINEVTQAWREKCQMQYVSYLLKAPATSGQVEAGGASLTADSGGDPITSLRDTDIDDGEGGTIHKTGLITSLLAVREQIRVNGGTADVLLLSPQMETLLLANAFTPGNAFIPETNEEWLRSGRIGRLYCIQTYTTNLIGSGTPLQIPVAGNAPANTGNALNCEYVMYDHDAFGIAADLWEPRVKDALEFTGSYGQCDSVMGGGVANPALAYAKINAVEA
jgi:hypothetical protein